MSDRDGDEVWDEADFEDAPDSEDEAVAEIRLSEEERLERQQTIMVIADAIFMNLPDVYQQAVDLDRVVLDALDYIDTYPRIGGKDLEHLATCLISTRLVRYELAKMARNRMQVDMGDHVETMSEIELFYKKTINACMKFGAIEGLAKIRHEDKYTTTLEMLQETLMRASAIVSGRCKNWPLWRQDDRAPKTFGKWIWKTLRNVASQEYQKEKVRHRNLFNNVAVMNSDRIKEEVGSNSYTTNSDDEIKMDDSDGDEISFEHALSDEPEETNNAAEDKVQTANQSMLIQETKEPEYQEDPRTNLESYQLLEKCLEVIEQSKAKRSKAVARAVLWLWWEDPTYEVREMMATLNECLEAILTKMAEEYCKHLWFGCGLTMTEVTKNELENARDLIQDRCRGIATAWS